MSNDLPPVEEVNAIVLVGSFNPAIFHPLWFSRENLISTEEAEKATIKLIIDDIAAFQLEWLDIEVQRTRFLASTRLASHVPLLRDLVI